MDRIVIAGNFNIKDTNAAGKRVLGLAEALKSKHEILLIGCHNENTFCPVTMDTDGFYKAYYPYPTSNTERFNVNSYAKFALSEIKKIEGVKVIISYGSPVLSVFVKKMMNWCRKEKVLFIFDCVDMIFKSGAGGISDTVKYVDMHYLKDRLALQSDGIIAISTNIERHYRGKTSKPIVVIPPITNMTLDSSIASNEKQILDVVYAGRPFGKTPNIKKENMKDRLDSAIKLMAGVADQEVDLRFTIYGITKEDYLISVPEHRELLEQYIMITFEGLQPQNAVEKAIKDADFTVLCRDKNFVTESGFPTKFTESLSVGTPVICTLTSDIPHYLKEGLNGVSVSYEITEEDIRKVASLFKDRDTVVSMKRYCADSYPFEPSDYTESMVKFLEDCGSARGYEI